jgi:hypothetical protein
VWALGAFLYTVLLKVAVPIELGTLRLPGAPSERVSLHPAGAAS